MGIEGIFSRGRNIVTVGLFAASLSACSTYDSTPIDGKIELSNIPKEQAFEYVHYGKYLQEPKITDNVVEKVEHYCNKKTDFEYCILKKTEFPDPNNDLYRGVNDERYIVTIIKNEERRLIFAKAITGNPVNVGEFIQDMYMPFGNNPDAKYLNKEFPPEKWEEFVKSPLMSLETLAPNRIGEYRGKYTQEEINAFNYLTFIPRLREFLRDLAENYLMAPIKSTFTICCLEEK